MVHHPHPLTNLAVKVKDFEILRWSFWLKVFRIGYLLNLWMDLVDTIPDVQYWSKVLRCFIPTPHRLTDLEVKVTDLEFFMINEMSISHISHSSESNHLSNVRTLEGLLPFHNYCPPGYMPWGGAGGKKYRTSSYSGERGGSVVECRTPEREVRGSRPTAAVLCPWARHFTPRKYWLITQEAMAPSRHDWKIFDWDVKPQHNQPNPHTLVILSSFLARLYVSTDRAIAVTTASALASASLKMFKFLVKVFESLYLLNPWMDLGDTLPDVTYWSEVLCCTITTHIGDLEVKVTDFEILS